VATDVGFTNIVQTKTSTLSTTTLSALADNTYFWRVRARDAANNWSAYSAPFTLTVDAVAFHFEGSSSHLGNLYSGAFSFDVWLGTRGNKHMR
jgi:hypothetical protein